ncbi:hypothetical protein K493DRAFT_316541 [Basidiobolus meristosporus CBS 931.73]|uniref:Calcium uniporter protein, mitochondrial n=1 Tax=Basidiobolus meristosporus CBS 931.73 TaxID=1314790 RepID=A0A1Y1Y3E5_9FUNG|nr:hypothetical protein K493DRAFT_316541 [Basidiobolus meristosporus CBS 931.73]|eukprot:ORX92541.1 hypothetical protein K493DRAFT_316541 [Basidiobolus meristosporus CBS 931.73]
MRAGLLHVISKYASKPARTGLLQARLLPSPLNSCRSIVSCGFPWQGLNLLEPRIRFNRAWFTRELRQFTTQTNQLKPEERNQVEFINDADGGQVAMGYLDFDTYSGNPRFFLPIPVPNLKSAQLASMLLDFTLPISTISQQIKEEYPEIKRVTIHEALYGLKVGEDWTCDYQVDDLVRAATCGEIKGFIVIIDNEKVFVKIPTFEERAAGLVRQHNHLMSKIESMSTLKQSLDRQAQTASIILATGSFTGLVTYIGVMARLTWWDYGWDVMEPVAYFTSIGMGIVGYLYFLITKREYTYEALAHYAVSQRQMKLYIKHGLDINQYQNLVNEAKKLERKIDKVRDDYE